MEKMQIRDQLRRICCRAKMILKKGKVHHRTQVLTLPTFLWLLKLLRFKTNLPQPSHHTNLQLLSVNIILKLLSANINLKPLSINSNLPRHSTNSYLQLHSTKHNQQLHSCSKPYRFPTLLADQACLHLRGEEPT